MPHAVSDRLVSLIAPALLWALLGCSTRWSQVPNQPLETSRDENFSDEQGPRSEPSPMASDHHPQAVASRWHGDESSQSGSAPPPAYSDVAISEPQTTAAASTQVVYREDHQPLRSIDRTAPFFYSQRDASLADLFGGAGNFGINSQLCWPAALAYQTRYLWEKRQPQLTKLESSLGGPEASQLVRHLTTKCQTSLRDGTTVPSGATCIDQLLRDAGYAPEIEVIGVDAVWAAAGMYPDSVRTQNRPAQLTDMVQNLELDRSIIALIGFYVLDPTTQKWRRHSGHFLSITGFAHSDTHSLVRVVNPARLLAPNSPPLHDWVQAQALTWSEARADLPANNSLELVGDGVSFGGYKTVLESLVIFSARPL